MRRQQSANDTVAWLRAADNPDQVAGAAFLVQHDLALTCAHVVRDHLGLGKPTPKEVPSAIVKLQFQVLRAEVEATVVPTGWWPDGAGEDLDDIAVLQLVQPLTDLEFISLALNRPQPKEPCYIFGAVSGYQDLGQIVYAQLAGGANALGRYQLDAEPGRERSYFVERGFSGAPVFDLRGNTIWGLVVAVDAGNHQVAFAVAAEDLRKAVRVARLVTAARDKGEQHGTNDASSEEKVEYTSWSNKKKTEVKHVEFLKELHKVRGIISEDTRKDIEKRCVTEWYESETSE